MTDKARLALLREAIDYLERTKQGHVQWVADGKPATHWKNAIVYLRRLEQDLVPVSIPALGPIWVGGPSVLRHDLTHRTLGLPTNGAGNLWPALDDAFVQGRAVIAPENIEVIAPLTSSNPGEAFYAKGRSKIRYWFGHLDRSHAIGAKFAKGSFVGRVAPNSIGGGPHCHLALNIELLFGQGKALIHHTNYTHGAPTIGEQLRRLLS